MASGPCVFALTKPDSTGSILDVDRWGKVQMSSQHRSSHETEADGMGGASQRHGRAWVAVLAMLILASCERVPSKSDYVSARVTEMCKDQTSQDLQACRLAVIGEFSRVPLEEMQRRYPSPEPRMRPSCGV
jgi:hypothetical protein